jgi:hypothetical protein
MRIRVIERVFERVLRRVVGISGRRGVKMCRRGVNLAINSHQKMNTKVSLIKQYNIHLSIW